jgi:signal transduction histidine kinase
MSLRLRVVLFTLAILLPAVGGGAWVVFANVSRERIAMESRLRETTRALSLVVDRELERRAAIVQVLAASPQVQDLDLESFCRLARASQVGTRGPIALMDRDHQYANTMLPDCLVPVERRNVAAAGFSADGLVLSDLFMGAVTQELLTVLSAPVTVGSKLYNVALAIRPSELQQMLVDQKLPPGWTAAVVNQQGRIVARLPDPDRWVGRPASPAALTLMSSSREGNYVGKNLDGRDAHVYYGASTRFGMTLFVSVPPSVINGNSSRSTLEVGLGALLLLLLGVGISLWAGRRAGRPIEALQSAAIDLEAGRGVEVPRTGIAELDQVGRALMRASERIRASNLALEQRVAAVVAEVESTQARLVQSQKLEVIGRLTGGIAHDFNNLLQTLSTGLHVLEQTVQDARARPLIDAGLRAVGRASRLVQQLLSFGRHASLTRQPMDLRNQLLSMETLLVKAMPASIVLHMDLAPDLWAMDTDPSQLEVALLNLIFNSRDAMEQGGVITIRARNQPRPEGDRVVIDVHDTGPGVPAEILAQIFEPFFTTKPVGRGTGLGLAQVRAFAQESGGSATAHSAPADGTTITLALPRSLRPVPQEESSPEPVVVSRAYRLLFVEDDVMIAEVVASALTGAGFQVVHARSGDQALALLRGGTDFDAVFSDVVMPGSISGIQLAETLAVEFPRTPVVLASGYAGDVAGVDSLARTVLTKPYSVQSVIRALVEALARNE